MLKNGVAAINNIGNKAALGVMLAKLIWRKR
jgi:hypothetical protein